MTQVLIISKTKKGKTGVCVGGITLPDLVSVRIMKANGEYHKLDTPYEIGQIWEMEFTKPDKIKPPHVENVWIQEEEFQKQEEKLLSIIGNDKLKRIVWKGHPQELFDGKLGWTGKRHGYVAERLGVPKSSTGFWIPDKDLTYDEPPYYFYNDGKGKWNSSFGFKYVGFEKPVKIIKAGTTVRVSLATWWVQDGVDLELRCYLQLSGWYNA